MYKNFQFQILILMYKNNFYFIWLGSACFCRSSHPVNQTVQKCNTQEVQKKQAGIEIPTDAIAGVGLTNWSNPPDDIIFRPLVANIKSCKLLWTGYWSRRPFLETIFFACIVANTQPGAKSENWNSRETWNAVKIGTREPGTMRTSTMHTNNSAFELLKKWSF